MSEENNRDSYLEDMGIEPLILVKDLIRNIWIPILIGITCGMLVYMAEFMRYEPAYTSSATFLVSIKGEEKSYYSNIYSARKLAAAFPKVLSSDALIRRVCEDVGLEKLDTSQITAQQIGEMNLIRLDVTASNPVLAFRIMKSIMENYDSVSYFVVQNAIMDVLIEPEVPRTPDNVLNTDADTEKAFQIGFLAALLLVGYLSYRKNTVKNRKDVERKLETHFLASIYREPKKGRFLKRLSGKKTSILISNPTASFTFTETYKKLATRLSYVKTADLPYGKASEKSAPAVFGQGKAILVTSLSENEGKSTVAANLALAYAKQKRRVLLIDGDLRKPAQYRIFDTDMGEKKELGEYLYGKAQWKEVLFEGLPFGLKAVFSCQEYARSSELLSGEKMRELLEDCRRQFDYIVIDSPPMSMVADAEILAEQCDISVLVVRQDCSDIRDINDAIDVLRSCQARLAGCVLNRVITFPGISHSGGYGGYGYGYGYGYGHYGKKSDKGSRE